MLHSKHKMMSQDDCWHLLASVSGHLYSELRSTLLHSTPFIISLHLSTCFFIFLHLCYVFHVHTCVWQRDDIGGSALGIIKQVDPTADPIVAH